MSSTVSDFYADDADGKLSLITPIDPLFLIISLITSLSHSVSRSLVLRSLVSDLMHLRRHRRAFNPSRTSLKRFRSFPLLSLPRLSEERSLRTKRRRPTTRLARMRSVWVR